MGVFLLRNTYNNDRLCTLLPPKPSRITLANMAVFRDVTAVTQRTILRRGISSQRSRICTNRYFGWFYTCCPPCLLQFTPSFCNSFTTDVFLEKLKKKPNQTTIPFLILWLLTFDWDTISASSLLALCPADPACSPEIHFPAFTPA